MAKLQEAASVNGARTLGGLGVPARRPVSVNEPGGRSLASVVAEGSWFARRSVFWDSAFPFLRAEPKLDALLSAAWTVRRRLTRSRSRQNV